MKRNDLRPLAAEIQKIIVTSGVLDTEGKDQETADRVDALISKRHPRHAAISSGKGPLALVLKTIRIKKGKKASKNFAGAIAAQSAMQLYCLSPTLDTGGGGNQAEICDAIKIAMQAVVERFGEHLEAWQACVSGDGHTSDNDQWDLQDTDDGSPPTDFPIGVDGCEAHWERAQSDLEELETLQRGWDAGGCGV